MKLRLRFNKSTRVISFSEGKLKLVELRERVAQTFNIIGVDFDLSLNGRDRLDGEDTELSDVGVVSGDLIHVLSRSNLNENGCEGKQKEANEVATSSDVLVPSVSGGYSCKIMPPKKQVLTQTESKMEVSFSDSDACVSAQQTEVEVPETDTDVIEAAYKLEEPRSEAELREINRFLIEPVLCREATDSAVPNTLVQVFKNSGVNSKAEAMCAVLHVLMLETGFSIKCTTEKKPAAGCCMSLPADWRSVGSYKMTYEHAACEESMCNLVIVPLGSQVMVHGVLKGGEPQSPVQTQFRLADYVTNVQPDVVKVYCNLPKLSRLFKDAIALPLLHAIHSAVGSCALQGFTGLSTEIKLLILKYLDVASLLNLAQVSKSWNTLVRDPWLWRRNYLLYWPKKADNDLNQNWQELYKKEYKRRKDLRERLRRMTPVLPHHPFFPRPPPLPGYVPGLPYGGGIVGGDFDLHPNFGFPDPVFPGSGQRIFPERLTHILHPRFDPMGPDPEISQPFAGAPPPGRAPRFGGGRHFGGMHPRFL